ncbi:MAG: hypothetical protein KDA33_14560, partial [Phycisphaerales bacterium]|nr:hypothetical protein [Phycisphaerales bacterium]
RRLARAVGAVAACFGMLLTAATLGAAGRFNPWRLCDTQPFSRIANWLAPPPPQLIAGDICVPAIPVSQGAAGTCRSPEEIETTGMTHEPSATD